MIYFWDIQFTKSMCFLRSESVLSVTFASELADVFWFSAAFVVDIIVFHQFATDKNDEQTQL